MNFAGCGDVENNTTLHSNLQVNGKHKIKFKYFYIIIINKYVETQLMS